MASEDEYINTSQSAELRRAVSALPPEERGPFLLAQIEKGRDFIAEAARARAARGAGSIYGVTPDYVESLKRAGFTEKQIEDDAIRAEYEDSVFDRRAVQAAKREFAKLSREEQRAARERYRLLGHIGGYDQFGAPTGAERQPSTQLTPMSQFSPVDPNKPVGPPNPFQRYYGPGDVRRASGRSYRPKGQVYSEAKPPFRRHGEEVPEWQSNPYGYHADSERLGRFKSPYTLEVGPPSLPYQLLDEQELLDEAAMARALELSGGAGSTSQYMPQGPRTKAPPAASRTKRME